MDPFIGEIRILPYTYAPRDWAYCDGELYPISQNPVLFSIIGDLYGGDARTTFGLPNLQGRAPMHSGTGPGLSRRVLSEHGGYPLVPLNEQNLPSHTHQALAYKNKADLSSPENNFLAVETDPEIFAWATVTDTNRLTSMAPPALKAAGAPQGYHENRQPFLVTSFCICMDGVYPQRPS